MTLNYEDFLKQYILDEDNNVVVASSMEEWGEFFRDTARRTVVRDNNVNGYDVSTVFLGIDHSYSPSGPPLLFETMVFGEDSDVYCDRYSTWKEAEEGHARALQLVKEGKIEAYDPVEPEYAPVEPEDFWTGRVAQIYIPVGFDSHGKKD